MIYDFSDIPGLYAYFSATEGASDTTGSVVNSTTSVSGSAHPLVLTSTGTSTVSILADQVGAMPGFFSTDGMSKNAILKHTFGGFQSTPNGYTMAVLYKIVQHTGFTHLCSMTNDTGTYGLRCSSGGTNWTITCYKTSTSPEAIPVPTGTVSTHIISAGATSGNGKWYRDGVLDANAPLASGGDPGFAEIGLLGRAHSPSTTSMDAAIAICVIYDRQIDDTEATDLHDLLAYWAANNAAPAAGPPTFATFGPVATTDDPSVTGWQWEESSNGTDWADVGTILTDTSGQTTTALTVNSAPVSADQTQVRCKAVSANAPDGVFSNAATLTVVGSGVTKFSDVDDLIVVWNAAESVIDKTGNVVNSVTGVAGEGSVPGTQLVAKSVNGDVTHGVETIGSMATFNTPNASSEAGLLVGDMNFGPAYSLVWVEQRYATGSGNESWQLERGDNGAISTFERWSSNYGIITNNNTRQTTTATVSLNPVVCVLAVGDSPNTGKLVMKGADIDETLNLVFSNTSYIGEQFCILGEYGATSTACLRGRLSIMAVYNRMLTDQEITDLITLCDTWVNTGAAP